jgi:ribosomal protein S18 acetylase RimI-like enzyme
MTSELQQAIKDNLYFRPMADEDVDKIKEIQRACDYKAEDSIIADIVDESPNMHCRVLELLKKGKFVDERVKLVIGSCIFQKFDGQLYLADLNISPQFQRRGFGAYIVDKFKAMLKPDGRTNLMVIVNEENLGGLQFFKSQGFLARKLHHKLFGDVDGIEMVYDSMVRQEPNPPSGV